MATSDQLAKGSGDIGHQIQMLSSVQNRHSQWSTLHTKYTLDDLRLHECSNWGVECQQSMHCQHNLQELEVR